MQRNIVVGLYQCVTTRSQQLQCHATVWRYNYVEKTNAMIATSKLLGFLFIKLKSFFGVVIIIVTALLCKFIAQWHKNSLMHSRH